ncbi:MAG: protein kinase domain-containing protein [Wenzhouxiangella sp.]
MSSQNEDRWRRKSTLFDLLVELPDGEREQRLIEIAAEDAELAGELVQMLAADAAQGVLDQALPDRIQNLSGRPDADRTGSLVGRYRLIELFGRGGMGEVWLAERVDEDGSGQQVAVKILRRGMHSEDIVARFLQERRILASLEHPGIARFIDGGMTEDDLPFFVMERVNGQAITDYARQQSLGVRERVGLLLAVCDAVAYAQQRLVVHRDLKPSNVLVDEDGRVRLLDFGIAKLLEDGPDGRETASGLLAMSPAYAAPEQILGQPVSTATDVYALGLLAYELLTDSLPHQRGTASLLELASQLSHVQIERPSQVLRRATATAPDLATARYRRELSRDLELVLLKALRPEPERRYPDANSLAADLGRWLDGEPVHAAGDSTRYRLTKFVSRYRSAVAATGLIILALATGLGAALNQAERARDAAALAVLEAEGARQSRDFLIRLFADANIMSNPSGAQLTVAELLSRAADRLDDSLPGQPSARAELSAVIAHGLHQVGERETALAIAARTLEQLKTAAVPNPSAQGRAYAHLANLYMQQGDWQQAESVLQAGLQVVDQTPSQGEWNGRLVMLENLVSLETRFGNDPQRRLDLMERVLDERLAVLGPDDIGLFAAYLNLASAHAALFQLEPSLRAARQAQRVGELQYPPGHLRWVEFHTSRGSNLQTVGDLQGALDALEQAGALLDYSLPEQRALGLHLLLQLGLVHADLGQSDEAAGYFDRAASLAADMGDARSLRYTYAFRSPFDLRQGWWQEVDQDVKAYLSLGRPGSSPQTASAWNMQAIAALLNQRCGSEAPTLTVAQIVQAVDQHHAGDHRNRAFARCLQAAAEDDSQRAQALRVEALALMQEGFPPTHYRVTEFDRFCQLPDPATSCGQTRPASQ